ncbi:lysine N(6)-hydroxylase/L-ornithine N(5)-oxygenase family protein [Acidiphilium sp. PA]|uniref:FAD-dependent oxidoreductase n=1 Tax=Acidiphilium sp. PA TaxID=2871705 RepID=UPI0022446D46|nr:FAD-dependent oxidoreductase [Acidiphilium sp. PA]MCW8308614.1 lysine N(6)-hydroxylase/L-ornithine N(5)-oxygenase family protein [Acidiphilium sp. PA]
MKILDVAIVGAGPYGLSLAAELGRHDVDVCVFGPAMAFWHDNMPPGTKLKSDGQSSDLPAPGAGFPICHYQMETTGTFEATRPIPVTEFHDYGIRFRDRMVPRADQRMVRDVGRTGGDFVVTLGDGTHVLARNVVIAVGVAAFPYVPAPLAALPAGYVSHSVQYGPVAALAGKRVAVIGAGASAIDVAAALHEAGADTQIITRRAAIAFHHPPTRRPLRHRVRRPDSGIGGGWDLWFYANFPQLFHALPEPLRLRIVANTLGAAPGWFMRERIEGRVPMRTGMTIRSVTAANGVVTFDLRDRRGGERQIEVDHVVAATGFRPDVARLNMLDPALVSAIRTAGMAPVLSRRFETSVRGLYMIGPIAAPSFGPVMRFVFGARSTTPVLARHLARQCARMVPVAASQSVRQAVYRQPGE